MELGIVTIQRDRAPWLTEWFAFHYLVGFRKFYFYAHHCTDNTLAILVKLSEKLNIQSFVIPEKMDKVQLMAYQHACDNFMNDIDWMAFIDGDEFLFPTNTLTMQDALFEYQNRNVSAIGVFNIIFGSSGHISEPEGLITKNFRRCSLNPDLYANRHLKSIVKGHQSVQVSGCSHVFATPNGTIDELNRPITWGVMDTYIPSYEKFRINHYCCQSYEFFTKFKRSSGHADAGANSPRSEEWWLSHDKNEDLDESLFRFADELEKTINWLNES
jgi:hypothetical protein